MSVLIGLCLLVAGCYQSDRQAREYLLKQFPLGLIRGDVEQRLSTQQWTRRVDETRPKDGWSTSRPAGMEHIRLIESTTGRHIERWEQYEGVATIFSLAIARFYFDDSDRLFDIEVHITD